MIKCKFISREAVRENPKLIFVFGDNLVREGFGGQAAAMRGEPNAVGIATKNFPGMEEKDFFTDNDFEVAKLNIDCGFKLLHDAIDRGLMIVWPTDDIGTGRAQLPTRAPKIWNYIQEQKKSLEEHHNAAFPTGEGKHESTTLTL